MSIDKSQTLILGGNITTKKIRSSNLELYRIIVMLLIVAHHYVVNSGLTHEMELNPLSPNSIFYLLFGAWGKTGINCFVLITGYFMCKTEIRLRKFLKLFLWVLTYSIIITGLFSIAGYCPKGIMRMWYGVIPLKRLTDGFTSCFIVFYLCIPFLNILIRNLSKRQHICLICLLLFIYTLHGTIPSLRVNMNYVSWFSTLYIISAYLRMYPFKRDKDVKFWAILTALSWSISIVSVLILNYIQYRFIGVASTGRSYFLISDSNAILALSNGICSFMLFKNIKIKNNKIINTIAASSFAVLLIHANSDTMRQWLWKDIIDCVGHYDTNLYWLYAIVCVLAIYVVCTIIDIIRIKTIETPMLNFTERFCINIYNKFNKKYTL